MDVYQRKQDLVREASNFQPPVHHVIRIMRIPFIFYLNAPLVLLCDLMANYDKI